MPSELLVEVCKIDEIQSHPNADTLEIAIIKGWQVIVKIGSYKPGDMIVYFPPDTMIPEELAKKLGVDKYISFKDGVGRVRSARLRSRPSHGFASSINDIAAVFPDLKLEDGDNIAESIGCKKYEPPEPGFAHNKIKHGKPTKNHESFYKYTDIQNYRHYPNLFEEGELVVATEKIHGTNVRVGIMVNNNKRWYKPWTWIQKKNEWACGSHNVQRNIKDAGVYALPLKDDNMQNMLIHIVKIKAPKESVIVYGEIYGSNIQTGFSYGRSEPAYAVFDISIDGEYQDWSFVCSMSAMFNIPRVPEVYRSAFNKEVISRIVGGNTLLMDTNPHMREGIVIKPEKEARLPNGARKILKYVSDEYLTRKGGSEYH